MPNYVSAVANYVRGAGSEVYGALSNMGRPAARGLTVLGAAVGSLGLADVVRAAVNETQQQFTNGTAPNATAHVATTPKPGFESVLMIAAVAFAAVWFVRRRPGER